MPEYFEIFPFFVTRFPYYFNQQKTRWTGKLIAGAIESSANAIGGFLPAGCSEQFRSAGLMTFRGQRGDLHIIPHGGAYADADNGTDHVCNHPDRLCPKSLCVALYFIRLDLYPYFTSCPTRRSSVKRSELAVARKRAGRPFAVSPLTTGTSFDSFSLFFFFLNVIPFPCQPRRLTFPKDRSINVKRNVNGVRRRGDGGERSIILFLFFNNDFRELSSTFPRIAGSLKIESNRE